MYEGIWFVAGVVAGALGMAWWARTRLIRLVSERTRETISEIRGTYNGGNHIDPSDE